MKAIIFRLLAFVPCCVPFHGASAIPISDSSPAIFNFSVLPADFVIFRLFLRDGQPNGVITSLDVYGEWDAVAPQVGVLLTGQRDPGDRGGFRLVHPAVTDGIFSIALRTTSSAPLGVDYCVSVQQSMEPCLAPAVVLEPGTVSLLGPALMGLAVSRRRK